MFGTFARSELTASELAKWEDTLDMFARCGNITLGYIGSKYASRFATLGLLKYFRGRFELTETGMAAE